MAQNESGQVQVVVIASPESDESQDMSGDQQPDMSREEKIAAAIRMVYAGGVRGTVARHFGLSATTLSRHLSGNLKKRGGQPVFTKQQERVFVEHLLKLSDWLVPISRHCFQSYVQFYLKSVGKHVPRFQDNRPGKDWAYSFFKRNKEVTQRRSNIIPPSKALVTVESLRQFFDLLSPQLSGDDAIDPSCILNYDETALTNDPGSQHVIVRRSQKNNRKVMKKSKAGFSVMFAGSASGVMLPPYVVYKSTSKTGNVNPKWMEGYPPPYAEYDTSESGWFKMKQFERWFEIIVLPWANKSPEKRKLVIGDNLSAHFSPKVFHLCRQNNISFKCLPPNTTHFLQPLDVAVFSPVKRQWRAILDQWRESNPRASYNKQEFSHRLAQLMEGINENNVKRGFEATGLWPFNIDKAIGHMPINEQPKLDETGSVLVDYLKDRTDAIRPKPSKRALSKPPPGTDLQDEPSSSSPAAVQPPAKKLKTAKRVNVNIAKKVNVNTPQKVKVVKPRTNVLFNTNTNSRPVRTLKPPKRYTASLEK